MMSYGEKIERAERNARRAKEKGSPKRRTQIDLGPGIPVNGSCQRRYIHDFDEAIRRGLEAKNNG